MVSVLVNRLRHALAAIGLLTILVHATPLTYWWAGWLSGPYSDAPGEVLLVPTGAVHPDGVIGLGAYWRTVYTLNAWRAVPSRLILLSGGGAFAPQAAEADVVRDFLLANGVPADKITVESKSISTHENALFSAPLAARLPGRKLLLTSDYHMFRALRVYRKAGIDCQPLPIPDIRKRSLISWRNRGHLFLELGFETVKIVYYAARGWI
jgi:uncharacterized SAM-binding protein YcdF (DUF218 family)